MFLLPVTLLISLLTLSIFAYPQTPSTPYDRNDSPSSRISTTILSNNGTDVTTSFHTRVYYRPKIVAPDPSLTSRDNSFNLNPRGTMTYSYLGRPIGGDGLCRSPTAQFQHSICKRTLGLSASVQDFLVYCQESVQASRTTRTRYTPQPSTANRGGPAGTSYQPHDPPVLAEEGSCFADEICIDGVFAGKGYPALASCVLEDDFESDENEDITEELAGKMARVTVTQLDGRTPVKMRKLDIAAARGGGSSSGASGSGQKKQCGGCYDLHTEILAPNTEALKMEASLMTAGTMAGILWVAVLSG